MTDNLPRLVEDAAKAMVKVYNDHAIEGRKAVTPVDLLAARAALEASRPMTDNLPKLVKERASEMIAWAIEGADDDFAFEIRREDREEGRVLTVADLRAVTTALEASQADVVRLREA